MINSRIKYFFSFCVIYFGVYSHLLICQKQRVPPLPADAQHSRALHEYKSQHRWKYVGKPG